MNRKKVLFVIYTIFGGGAEKQMQYILQYINREAFEPHLCVFHLNGEERELIPRDVFLHDLSTVLRPASLFLIGKLAKLAKEIKPHTIVSFTWGVNLIAIAAGLLVRIPVIVSERIYTFSSIKKYSFWHLRRLAISILYKSATKITAVSKDVKNGLIKYFYVPKEKIEIVYNGVDLDVIDKRSTEYNVAIEDYILSCGSLTKKKKFGFLIEAVSLIPNSTVVLLGQGPLQRHLEQKAKKLGVNLVLTGYVKNPYPYFKHAKVFVSSSEYEGFSNVILEAMSCGVPVVAVDCPGGIREIIDHGQNGIIVRENDTKELSSAVMKIIKDPHLSQQLVNKAQEKIAGFSVKDMVKKYENIIG